MRHRFVDSFDKISDSAADFSKSLMTMADYVDGSIVQIVKKACIDLYRRIVERTPVDTGRAKASWGLSIFNSADVATKSKYSESQISEIINTEVRDFTTKRLGTQVVIYNNLEYIEFLENGSSGQAPTGMVTVSLVEFETHFNLALEGLKGVSLA